ncbi:MAG: J domain-containing protein, partial [Myxococcales bacterium]|nr:J domain-containing protein [Myxococcales bacterium]
MTSSGHIDGVGDPDQPIKLVGGVDVARLALSAMEGFILSRIDGYTTVSQLCVISGLGELATLDVIRKLRSQGVVIVGDEAPQVAAAAVTVGVAGGQGDWDDETLDDDEDDDELIDEHDERPHDDGHAFAPPDAEPRIRLTGDQLKASASGIHELDHAAVESELDSELHDDIDLDRQTRKKIRTMFAQLGDFNFFELLDVEATADARTIRRAYFKRSKEFHPDRFYTRRLGRYSDMLAEIFKQVSAAHSFLQDEEQRRAYAEMVLQEQASEDLGHELEAESRRLLEAEGLTDAAAAVDGSYTFTRKRGLSQREQVSKGLGEVQQPSSGGTGPRIDGPRTARTGTAAALRNRVARRAGTLPKGIAKPVDTPERAARR